MKTIRFYTLLYIDKENESLSKNGISGKFDQQMMTFIKCCETLSKSLRFFINYDLGVLTNNPSYIKNKSEILNCIEIDFSFKVPPGIAFASAHRKIDAFNYFAGLNSEEYSILIDSDVLCINKMPLNLINCIRNNTPVFYDTTEQRYPAYGRETLIKDKEKLMPERLSNGMWAGGEFIGGDNNFFKLLHDEIMQIQDHYFNNYKSLHHQGDEALVSVVLEKIMLHNYVCNAGVFGAIGRYWSVKPLHVQNHWKSYKNNFLVHLPADKKFLASLDNVDEKLTYKYEMYLKKGAPLRFAKRMIRKVLKAS